MKKYFKLRCSRQNAAYCLIIITIEELSSWSIQNQPKTLHSLAAAVACIVTWAILQSLYMPF